MRFLYFIFIGFVVADSIALNRYVNNSLRHISRQRVTRVSAELSPDEPVNVNNNDLLMTYRAFILKKMLKNGEPDRAKRLLTAVQAKGLNKNLRRRRELFRQSF